MYNKYGFKLQLYLFSSVSCVTNYINLTGKLIIEGELIGYVRVYISKS